MRKSLKYGDALKLARIAIESDYNVDAFTMSSILALFYDMDKETTLYDIIVK